MKLIKTKKNKTIIHINYLKKKNVLVYLKIATKLKLKNKFFIYTYLGFLDKIFTIFINEITIRT